MNTNNRSKIDVDFVLIKDRWSISLSLSLSLSYCINQRNIYWLLLQFIIKRERIYILYRCNNNKQRTAILIYNYSYGEWGQDEGLLNCTGMEITSTDWLTKGAGASQDIVVHYSTLLNLFCHNHSVQFEHILWFKRIVSTTKRLIGTKEENQSMNIKRRN